jgi:hypothetical protein
MQPHPFDNLRLTLMQQVLPVGLALVERVRRGGPGELASAFDSRAGDPLDQLRQEGEPAASRLRDQLDQVSPGLGNPVMPVEVREVDEAPGTPLAAETGPDPDPDALPARLSQISRRLRLLEHRLQLGA